MRRELTTSQTDPLRELEVMMHRMLMVAEGAIDVPVLIAQDAYTALCARDNVIAALDFWDGTLDDLAGYLRMMGVLIKGMLRFKEGMPPINNKPGKPLFDVLVSETLSPRGHEEKPGRPIFNVFIVGDPQMKGKIGNHIAESDLRRARQQFESYDPAIRDVVGSCAVVHYAILVDGEKEGAAAAMQMFNIIQTTLDHHEDNVEELIKLQRGGASREISSEKDDGDLLNAKLGSLQKSIEDLLGVKREELDLKDLLAFAHWRVGAAILGIDNYFREEKALTSEAEDAGFSGVTLCTLLQPKFLPAYYDQALYMASRPRRFSPKEALDIAMSGLDAVRLGARGNGESLAAPPWAQLQLYWIAAKAVLAGALMKPNQQGVHRHRDIDSCYFTAGQLRSYVEASEVLLERMRLWAGNNSEFSRLDKEVKGWREKYITGKDENEQQKSIPMRCVASQWVARDGDGEKKGDIFANLPKSGRCNETSRGTMSTSKWDHVREMMATMERMRNVVDGVIEAPALTRKDAAAALDVCDSISQAPDLWDGTLKDLAGYLRMMGAIIKGTLQIKEVMPPIYKKEPPLFDHFIAESIAPGGRHKKISLPIFNVFLAGDRTREGKNMLLIQPKANLDLEKARQQYESYHPAVCDVVGALAVLHYAIMMDGRKDEAQLAVQIFTDILEILRYNDTEHGTELARRKFEASSVDNNDDKSSADKDEEKKEMLPEAKLDSLQKSLQDELGVTREEFDLEDLGAYCNWRLGPALLGIDNYYRDERAPGADILEQAGLVSLKLCPMAQPEYLPPYYDYALYMASRPNKYKPVDVMSVALSGLKSARVVAAEAAGGDFLPLVKGPWGQLRLIWIAAKAALAGTLQDENGAYYFSAGRMRLLVEEAEEVLERMRPWACNMVEYRKIDGDFEEWRRKYFVGRDENEHQKPVPMRCIASQWTAQDGGAEGGGGEKLCASCENTSDKLKACAACKQVWYCNAVCQKAGWKAHKKACIALRKNL